MNFYRSCSWLKHAKNVLDVNIGAEPIARLLHQIQDARCHHPLTCIARERSHSMSTKTAELKSCPFKKGDVVRNNYADAENPHRYLMFLKCGTIRQGQYTHKSYDCIVYSGQRVQLFRDDSQLEKVGHMDEFDEYCMALKRLNGRFDNEH